MLKSFQRLHVLVKCMAWTRWKSQSKSHCQMQNLYSTFQNKNSKSWLLVNMRYTYKYYKNTQTINQTNNYQLDISYGVFCSVLLYLVSDSLSVEKEDVILRYYEKILHIQWLFMQRRSMGSSFGYQHSSKYLLHLFN